MSGKNRQTVGAAVEAAPASVPSQTAATAGEAGSPIVPQGETPAATEPEAPSLAAELEASLRQQLADVQQELEKERQAHRETADDRDELLAQVEQLREELDSNNESDDEPETEEADEHEHTRQLLKQYGLQRAWQDATGAVHFDETAALEAAGGEADSLTVIEPA